MKNRIPQLRVKVKSLAAESFIIRSDVRKHLKRARHQRDEDGTLKWSWDLVTAMSMHDHRVIKVRIAARLNTLALAALQGTAYSACEKKTSWAPDLKKVEEITSRFGGSVAQKEKMSTWLSEAKAHLVAQGFIVSKTGDILPPVKRIEVVNG
jgi:hypothetical protein